jgi:uncharacterized protein with PIN domain
VARAEGCAPTGFAAHFVEAIDPAEQLREVITAFQLLETARGLTGFLTRCLDCNAAILPIQKRIAAERVPAEILALHEAFFLCPRCERVYWRGSHFDRMREWVLSALPNA